MKIVHQIDGTKNYNKYKIIRKQPKIKITKRLFKRNYIMLTKKQNNLNI